MRKIQPKIKNKFCQFKKFLYICIWQKRKNPQKVRNTREFTKMKTQLVFGDTIQVNQPEDRMRLR